MWRRIRHRIFRSCSISSYYCTYNEQQRSFVKNTQTHTDVFCFTVDKTRGVLVKFLIKISDKKTFPIIFDHVFKRHIDNF